MALNLLNKFSQVLITHKISIVSNDWLLHVHCRLVEIFGCRTDITFTEITTIAIGDFLQLPPVRAGAVYAEYKNGWLTFYPFLDLLKIAELTEVMQERCDAEFMNLLNHICLAELNN